MVSAAFRGARQQQQQQPPQQQQPHQPDEKVQQTPPQQQPAPPTQETSIGPAVASTTPLQLPPPVAIGSVAPPPLSTTPTSWSPRTIDEARKKHISPIHITEPPTTTATTRATVSAQGMVLSPPPTPLYNIPTRPGRHTQLPSRPPSPQSTTPPQPSVDDGNAGADGYGGGVPTSAAAAATVMADEAEQLREMQALAELVAAQESPARAEQLYRYGHLLTDPTPVTVLGVSPSQGNASALSPSASKVHSARSPAAVIAASSFVEDDLGEGAPQPPPGSSVLVTGVGIGAVATVRAAPADNKTPPARVRRRSRTRASPSSMPTPSPMRPRVRAKVPAKVSRSPTVRGCCVTVVLMC